MINSMKDNDEWQTERRVKLMMNGRKKEERHHRYNENVKTF